MAVKARRLCRGLFVIVAVVFIVLQCGVAMAAPVTVQPGDSLWKISRANGISIQQLMAENNLTDSLIRPGQVLQVPGRSATSKERVNASPEEVMLLARLISAEASNQPYTGMVAVGAVVVNRMLSSKFPGTITEVIYQKGQFQPAMSGIISSAVVKDEHVKAARAALAGEDPTNGALYFFEFETVTDEWLWARPHKVTIGNHRFAA
jgi:N-acetylmuramoyl-L-alanine amidase